MQIDYIRRDVNEAISEDGGAFIQVVNKNTVGLKSSIDEAKAALYVVGASSMIEGYFTGIMRSVFEGIQEDGHPRTVGDITFYPVCGGTFDLDKGWDPKVNDVRIKARLLNGVTLDVTGWTFRDVTEGRVAFYVDTVSNGTLTGLVSTDAAAELNGRNFPPKEKLSVSWACGLKGSEVPANKFTANVARITVDKSAYSTLTADDDGKNILFTVKGCFNKATKSAVVKYVAPTVTKVATEGKNGVVKAKPFDATGTNLSFSAAAGDTAKVKWTEGSVAKEQSLTPTAVTTTKLSFDAVTALETAADDTPLTFEFKINGVTITQTATLLAREPLAESADHEVKIYTVEPEIGTTFYLGEDWKATGVKLGYDSTAETGIMDVRVEIEGVDPYHFALPATVPLATTELELPASAELPTGLTPGEHDANLIFDRVKGGQPSDLLTIPIKVMVRE